MRNSQPYILKQMLYLVVRYSNVKCSDLNKIVNDETFKEKCSFLMVMVKNDYSVKI